MALAGALCVLVHTVVGFTNRSLCAQVSSLLGGPYTSTQATYDLRRLRLKGLVQRLDNHHRYVLTPEGARLATFLHQAPPSSLTAAPGGGQTPRPHRVTTCPANYRRLHRGLCRPRPHLPARVTRLKLASGVNNRAPKEP